MNTQWQTWFNRHTDSDNASDAGGFPDYPQQLAAVETGAAVSILSAFQLIRVTGEEAQSFLQGQFSSDILAVDKTHSQLSSYSTAKGRMQASMLIWYESDSYYLMVSADIAAAFCKRLSMFILRSKVKAEIVGDERVLLGLAGAAAEAGVAGAPSVLYGVAECEGGVCLRLPSGALLLAVSPEAAQVRVSHLESTIIPVDAEAWGILDINAGIAWVTLATQEQFVALMTNLDLLGGVSFKKGCYPGQEIVARTHYLGKVKRRLYRAKVSAVAKSGDALYSPESKDQAIGMVVNVARKGSETLALIVVQSSRWEDGIFLRSLDGERFEKLSLPYDVDGE